MQPPVIAPAAIIIPVRVAPTVIPVPTVDSGSLRNLTLQMTLTKTKVTIISIKKVGRNTSFELHL